MSLQIVRQRTDCKTDLGPGPRHGNWALPGHGQAYDECGGFGWKGCLEVWRHAGTEHEGEAYLKKFRRSCGRAECPICYEQWASKEAHAAMRRFDAARRLGVLSRKKLIHVVASPPLALVEQLDNGELDYSRMRNQAYKNAIDSGAKGGMCIFHAFRWRCRICGLDDESCRCDGPEGVWYWSPHFHMVAYGWIDGTKANFEKTGWLVRNLGVRKSLYGTIQYQLSHAGVWMKDEGEGGEKGGEGILPLAKSKRVTITWFGSLSYNKLKIEREDYRELCPICQSPLVLVEYVGQGDPPSTLDGSGSDVGEMFLKVGIEHRLDWVAVKRYEGPERVTRHYE